MKKTDIFKNIKGFEFLYLGAIGVVIIERTLILINPVIIMYVLDNMIGKVEANKNSLLYKLIGDNFIKAAIIIALLTLIRAISLYYKNQLAGEASEGIAKNLKDKLYKHLQNLNYSYFSKVETGDIIQRCTSDVETVHNFLGKKVLDVVNIVMMIIISIVFMINLNLELTYLTLISIPILLTFTTVFFINVEKYYEEADEAEGQMSNILQENLNGIRVVKAFSKEKFEMEKFDKVNRDWKKKDIKLGKLFSLYGSLSDVIITLQVALILFVGINWTINSKITLGTLAAFLTYQTMLLYPVDAFGRVVAELGQAFVSIKRINEILDEPIDESHKKAKKHNISGNIRFDNVTFSFDNKEVLKNISFDIQKGETIGILGPTGSGKSTLVHLLTYLFSPTKGNIYIDNIDIKFFDKKHLRKNIGLILQEPFLFSRSIKDNIGFAHDNPIEKKIFEAAKIAKIHEGISSFKDGYETMVGEKGVSLSGGQKQRISIARTIINNVKILVFDDSLSALDNETDADIRKELEKKIHGVTKLIISHKISSLQNADKIIVLENGLISQRGIHKELINTEGFYKRVWEIQNSL